MNILLTIAYDGTNYCGWQNQLNGVTVQQRLEEALAELYGRTVSVVGASRTDAGVHALGQRAMFNIDEKDIQIPINKLPYAVNNNLPEDISVNYAEIAIDNFHPIFSAKAKTYEYKLYISPFINPFLKNYYCHIKHSLDLTAMKKAATYIIGEHNFAAFCASGSSTKTTVRTVFSLDIEDNNFHGVRVIAFRVRGNGFLYNMVRIIAGTLIYVGEGKINADKIPEIILSKEREKAGKTAPPQGLTLIKAEY